MPADNNRYGDLSEAEYFEFLAEIEEIDDSIEEAQEEAVEKISTEEEQSILSELPENEELEAYYGNDAWRKLYGDPFLYGRALQQKACESSVAANKKRVKKLKEDRIQIQRDAFSQTLVPLSNAIDKEELKYLISELVQSHTVMIDKYENFINKRITILLNPLIPRRIRMCKIMYPQSVKHCPGFLYTASEEYGKGLSFWTMPDIPYYFEQNTEQRILAENKSDFLFAIDKAITNYHMHIEKRTKKELKYASTLVQKKVYSYFDLLRLNPFWFEIVYNRLKEIY